MSRMVKVIFQETNLWILIVHICWKNCILSKKLAKFPLFVSKVVWKMFSRPLSILMVLRGEDFVSNRRRICRKTEVLVKSGKRFWQELLLLCCWIQTSFFNIYLLVIVSFCENIIWTENWLIEDLILLFEIFFLSSNCFVHKLFNW